MEEIYEKIRNINNEWDLMEISTLIIGLILILEGNYRMATLWYLVKYAILKSESSKAKGL